MTVPLINKCDRDSKEVPLFVAGVLQHPAYRFNSIYNFLDIFQEKTYNIIESEERVRDYRDQGIKGLSRDQLRYLFEEEIYPAAKGAPFMEADNKYEERVLNFGYQCFVRGVKLGKERFR